MFKRIAPFLICLMLGTAAYAQSTGGHGRAGGGGGKGSSGGSAPAPSGPAAPKPAVTPVNQLEIIGVVTAIDPQTQRVTIAYEAVEPLNWPPGTMPFPVAKTALLSAATVGEKVRFTVNGGQIASLKPFDPQ